MRRVDGWWIPDEHPNDKRHPATSQVDECAAQLAAAMPYLFDMRLCIQAGARVGVWPRALWAVGFAQVFAFEPEYENYRCALQNIAPCGRGVRLQRFALGPRSGHARLILSDQSSGEHYIDVGGHADDYAQLVEVRSLDELAVEHAWPAVDAIFLDVEGFESFVLHGARSVLERFRPTLVLEENATCGRYDVEPGTLRQMLGSFGYRPALAHSTLPPEIQNDGEFRGADLIFVHEDRERLEKLKAAQRAGALS